MVAPLISQIRLRKLAHFFGPGVFRWQLQTAPGRQAQYPTNFRSAFTFGYRFKTKSGHETYSQIYQDFQRNTNTIHANDGVECNLDDVGSSAEIIESDRVTRYPSNEAHSTEPFHHYIPKDPKYSSSNSLSNPEKFDNFLSDKNFSQLRSLDGIEKKSISIDQFGKFDSTYLKGLPASIHWEKFLAKKPTRSQNESSHFASEPISSKNSPEDKSLFFFQEFLSHLNSITVSTSSASTFCGHANVLNAIINNISLSESWSIYQENLSVNSKLISSPYFKQIGYILVKRTVDSKRINPYDSTVPDIRDVVNIMFQHGSLDCLQWADLVTALLEKVTAIKGQPVDDTSLILDIIGAWDVVTGKLEPNQLLSPSDAEDTYKKNGLYTLFGMIVPCFKSSNLAEIPLVAIATFSALLESLTTLSDQYTRIMPLIKSIAIAIDVPDLDISSLEYIKSSVAIKSFVFKNWTEIRRKAHQVLSLSGESENEIVQLSHKTINNHDVTTDPSPPMRGILTIQNGIQDAMKLKNHARLDELWSKVSQWQPNSCEYTLGLSGRYGILSLGICNRFIMAYMRLQRPTRAIEVWKHMVSKGLNPNIKSWNIVISGCGISGDWRSSEKLWKMMQLSGTKPDTLTWSARLSVLIKSKDIDMAIQALDEMGRLWLEKAKESRPDLSIDQVLLVENVENAVKPDVTCMNTVIDGLLRMGDKSRASKIITWARNFGVKPDTATYNILLRPLIRKGMSKEAMLLLKRMEKEGIEADVVTFTTILDEILGHSGQYEPEKLKEMIADVFGNMDRAKVKPNEFTYGKIVHQLVRDLNPNFSPIVDLVIQHMLNRDIQPSVQLYTNLIEYYLLQSPPNMDMGRHMIDNATSIVGLDRVFWEKAIDCYAKIGDTSTGLNLFRRLSRQNVRVGWSSLASLLRALLIRKEWHLAKGLVDEVQMRYARHDFREGTKSELDFKELVARVKAIEA